MYFMRSWLRLQIDKSATSQKIDKHPICDLGQKRRVKQIDNVFKTRYTPVIKSECRFLPADRHRLMNIG